MNQLTKTTQLSIAELPEQQVIAIQPAVAEAPDGLPAVLWRRRRLVLAGVALSLTAALVYLLVAQPLYTGTARLYVQQIGPQLLTSENQASAVRDDSYLFTQAEFLRSNPIIEPVVAQPDIRSMRWMQDVTNPLTFLKKRVDVSVGTKSRIISVAFDAADPAEAASVVNAIVASYIAYNSGENRSTTNELIKVLIAEKEKRDAELAAKSREVYEYKAQNGTLSFESDHGNVIVQRLAKLSDALTEAELVVVNARSNYQAAKAVGLSAARMRGLIEAQRIDSGRGAGSGAGSDTEEREARVDVGRMEMQLALMSGRYGENHPSVQAMRRGIEQRKAQIEQRDKEFCEAYVAATQAAWTTAEQRAREIRAQLDAQQKQAIDLNAKAAEYNRLQSERNRMEKLCDALDARIKELHVAQSGGAFNIHVLEPARAEERPSKPSKRVVLGAGLVAGLMAGIVLALLRERYDQRLYSADQIQEILDLPLLGVVPHMSGRATPRMRGSMVHLEPMSTVAEAYRTLRTAIHFGAASGRAKTVLVTSPTSGDGKSTVASNLAIVMAQAGRRVLLLDADCRRPMQHVLFELGEDGGFCSLLGGASTPEQAIRPTGIENLDVLPCGPIPPNPAEVLSGEPFAQLLAALQDRYDHVVIDSPPVGVVTDAQILSSIADASILVLRAERSTCREARYARDRLLSVGAKVLGVVVNDAPQRWASQGHYASYGSYTANRPRLPIGRAEGNELPPAEDRSEAALALPRNRRRAEP